MFNDYYYNKQYTVDKLALSILSDYSGSVSKIQVCSFVRLLLWAEVQPTLDLSAETS